MKSAFTILSEITQRSVVWRGAATAVGGVAGWCGSRRGRADRFAAKADDQATPTVALIARIVGERNAP